MDSWEIDRRRIKNESFEKNFQDSDELTGEDDRGKIT